MEAALFKECSKCRALKPYQHFRFRTTRRLNSQCRDCEREYGRNRHHSDLKRRLATKESKARPAPPGITSKICTRCERDKPLSAFETGRGKYQRRPICRECRANKNHEYDVKNWPRLRELQRHDPVKRLIINYRNYINKALRRVGHQKKSKTQEILGCTNEELRQHLQKSFEDGMSWENYGQHRRTGQRVWNVDHIQSLAGFDLIDPQQVRRAFHYTNLRPMWGFDNLSQGGTATHRRKREIRAW